MALDATAGGEFSNAYCTVVEATALLQERLATEAWYTQDPQASMTLPARREAALIWATRLLDEQIGWYGVPTSATQALAWPQTGQVDARRRPLDPLTVPRVIQMATALTALQLMATEGTISASTSALEPGVKSKRIGDMEIVYKDEVPQAVQEVLTGVPAEVRTMLRGYGTVPGLGMIPLLRT